LAKELTDIIEQRKLELSHAKAALKTYVPGGWKDEFVMISSGGHSGQVLVIGVPSMRLLKVIAVFTPEPWQGYGYGDVKTMRLLYKGSNGIRLLTLGDTHHPEISRTNAEYDGEWAFIGDKLNARVASISLKDFETKDIVKLPNTQTQHGGACATPNTEYIACGSQFPAPWEPGEGLQAREDVHQAHRGELRRVLQGNRDLPRLRQEDRQVRPEQELPDRAAALHAGPRGRGMGAERGMGLHELDQHGAAHRRGPRGQTIP
jgi:hypothetical protein